MATFREILTSILTTDAKKSIGNALGVHLGKTSTAPYGIYYINPPEVITSPHIAYSVLVSASYLPQTVTIMFRLVGGDRDAIKRRLYFLLHKQEIKFVTATDYKILYIGYNWTGPDVHDEDNQLYWNNERYLVKAVRKITDVS